MTVRKTADDYEIWRELEKASDRAAVIVSASYLEHALLDSILDKLRITAPSLIEDLTGNGAPLGTFSNKSMVAFATGVIGAKTRKDCDRIRKIRNLCAHDLNPIDFSAQKVRDLIASLTPRLVPQIQTTEDRPFWAEEPRERYIWCCEQIVSNLMYELPREPGQERRSELD